MLPSLAAIGQKVVQVRELLLRLLSRSAKEPFKFLYDHEFSIEKKVAIIRKEIYVADGIELSDLARRQVETYTRRGYSKYYLALGFTLPIRAVRLSAGAGFLYPILGDMQTMPGLGTRPGK